MPDIIVHNNQSTTTITADENTNLLATLKKHGISPETPCNGKGICGKCRVQIKDAGIIHTAEEKKLLSEDERKKGFHLACMTRVTGDMDVTIPTVSKDASIMTDTNTIEISGTPLVRKQHHILPAPSIEDQRADDDRMLQAFRGNQDTAGGKIQGGLSSGLSINRFPFGFLGTLPVILRQNDYQVTTVEILGHITGVEARDTSKTMFGVAVDIGTTTLAAYLYDLINGKRMAVRSMLNPQRKHGADVISRIDYASTGDDGGAELARLIRGALNQLIGGLVQDCGLTQNDIYVVTLVGNTTMLHLLLNLPARNIAAAPFIPVTVSGHVLTPPELDLAMNTSGRVIVLPSVAAYVGADTVAAVLSSRMHQTGEITLLVDIGTNGEIVLGNESMMYACSTAAGPAFEGANITCGIGGVDGAISKVSLLNDGAFDYHTIGGHKVTGICGSGLVDAIACMLKTGIIDDTGRIAEKDELPATASMHRDRIVEMNGMRAYVLVPRDPAGKTGEILITQKDIREVQNAKAAIAAGISVLIREAGLSSAQIGKVYLAGGFGSYLHIESAIAIGLLPKELSGRIYAIGNAAGAGAIHSLLSQEELYMSGRIAKTIRYLELSSRPDFVSEYTDNMFFDLNT